MSSVGACKNVLTNPAQRKSRCWKNWCEKGTLCIIAGSSFSSIHFIHAVNGFVMRVAFIFQLLNQAAARKSHIVEVFLRSFCCLLILIGAAVVGGVDRFGMGIVFIFQLLNEPGVGKRRVIEVFTGAL